MAFLVLAGTGVAGVLALLVAAGHYLPAALPGAAGAIAGAALGTAVLGGCLFAILHRAGRARAGGFQRLCLRVSVALAVALGRALGISPDRVRRSFITLNNRVVPRGAAPARTTVLLLPRCLQRSDCDRRLEMDPGLCRRCGRCDITPLLELGEAHGVLTRVVTGGTLARRVLTEARATAVVAVACERDLVAGILDALPIPVYAIWNLRPNGPCIDTNVVVARVEDGILRVVAKEEAR